MRDLRWDAARRLKTSQDSSQDETWLVQRIHAVTADGIEKPAETSIDSRYQDGDEGPTGFDQAANAARGDVLIKTRI
jgi:hypothetical protein